jgi:hypothetical protein
VGGSQAGRGIGKTSIRTLALFRQAALSGKPELGQSMDSREARRLGRELVAGLVYLLAAAPAPRVFLGVHTRREG